MQAGRDSNLDSIQAEAHPPHKLYRLDTVVFYLASINISYQEVFDLRIFRPRDRRDLLTDKPRRCRSRNHHHLGQVDTKEKSQSNESIEGF
jgi:hypothetical protein